MQTANAREQMIEQLVRAWDVLDARVLEVLRQVPRELFVPQRQRYRAYADVEVPLPCGQHMLRPSVAGRLLQALLPQRAESVLVIGAGSGFITACLRTMAAQVRALELFPEPSWRVAIWMRSACAMSRWWAPTHSTPTVARVSTRSR